MLKTKNAKRVIAAVTFLVICAATFLSGYKMQNVTAAGGTDYIRYDCTKKSVSYYTLPEIPKVGYANAMMLANVDYGDGDASDRYIAPNDQMIIRFAHYGTGFIIGDHEIMTAGHCVYNTTGFLSLDPMINTANPSNSKVDKIIHLTPVSIHIPKKYEKALEDKIQDHDPIKTACDFAIVTVKENLSEYGKFYLGVPTDTIKNKSSVPTHTLGYYRVDNDDIDYDYVLKKSNGIVKNIDTECIYTSADVNGGTCGGPIFIESRFGVDDETSGEYAYRTYRTAIGVVNAFSKYGDRDSTYYKGGILYDIYDGGGAKVDSEMLQFAYDNDYL